MFKPLNDDPRNADPEGTPPRCPVCAQDFEPETYLAFLWRHPALRNALCPDRPDLPGMVEHAHEIYEDIVRFLKKDVGPAYLRAKYK